MPMNKVVHAAQRAAFSAAIDSAIKAVRGKGPENMAEQAVKLVNLAQPLLAHRYPDADWDKVRSCVSDPNGKWMEYAYKAINEIDPHILKMNTLNLVYEGMFAGYNYVMELREKYDCNMHCVGCWAGEYGHKNNLSFDDMDKIVSQGKELGMYLYMLTGGEPLVRKADILKLAEKHNDVQFAIYTNSTLIDDAFCKEVVRLGNIAFMLSIEGTPETNDARRGSGHYAAVMHAMDLLKQYGILFGTSICYTSANIEAVTNDDFMRFLCDKGAHFGFYFHYMPVGNEAAPELMPTPEQRKYMIDRIRYLRSEDCDIPFYPMDFQNDGEFVGGCIAGGRNYFHINSAGDAEPCVFIHYSNANIHDSSILEILQSPLFMAYHNGQPFNKNHLRPCPMLENPELLRKMVHETGAHSTDLQSPETVDHLCDKCKAYADNWQPMADEIWSHTKIRESRYENYKDWKPGRQ